MKKIVFFAIATLVAFFVLSRLPHTAQARTIVVPTPTPAPVVSGN